MKLSMFRSTSSSFGAFGSVALLAIVVLVTSPVVSSKTYPMSDADNDWLGPAPYPIRSKRMADNLQLDQDLDKDDSMKLVSKRLARDVAQLVALKKASRLVKRNIGKDLQLLDEDSDFTYNNDIEHSKARGRSVWNRNADAHGDEDYSDDDVDDTKQNSGAQGRSVMSRNPDGNDLQLVDKDDYIDYDDIDHSKARGRSVLNRSPNADAPGDEDYSDDDVDDTKQNSEARGRSVLSRNPGADSPGDEDTSDDEPAEEAPAPKPHQAPRSLEPVVAQKAQGLKVKSLERAVVSKQVSSDDASKNRSDSGSSWTYVAAGVGTLALISAIAVGAFYVYQWTGARIATASGSTADDSLASKQMDQSGTATGSASRTTAVEQV